MEWVEKLVEFIEKEVGQEKVHKIIEFLENHFENFVSLNHSCDY